MTSRYWYFVGSRGTRSLSVIFLYHTAVSLVVSPWLHRGYSVPTLIPRPCVPTLSCNHPRNPPWDRRVPTGGYAYERRHYLAPIPRVVTWCPRVVTAWALRNLAWIQRGYTAKNNRSCLCSARPTMRGLGRWSMPNASAVANVSGPTNDLTSIRPALDGAARKIKLYPLQ